jgi:hypothetical protein
MQFIELSPQQKFTIIQQNLDDIGFITAINRIITNKRYEVIVNGELKKQYKTRRSAKLFIIKIYNNNADN